jgi:glycosyltransferase involved in cell wall biosynthesis
MSLNIAILSSTLSSAAGGLANSVPALAHEMAHNGAQISVVGLEDPNDSDAALLWGPKVYAHPVRGMRAFGYAPGLASTLRYLAPQLISVHGIWTYPSLANLQHYRRHCTPYVVTPHGMLDPWALERSSWKKNIVRFMYEDDHLSGASCLHATAEMEACHFRRLGLTNPIAIVPNGVEIPLPASSTRAPGELRRLLFLSRIHPKKGLPLLLRAWAKLEPRFHDWELMIAGPDEVGHLAEMQRVSHNLQLKRVRWSEPVYGDQKSALYRSADLFILPTYSENFGLVVAEALAHGVPVITTHNAPWGGLETHHCGWWIPLGESEIANALIHAMTRPLGELRAMGIRGREWMVSDFGCAEVAQRMIEVYQWAISGGTPPSCVYLV